MKNLKITLCLVIATITGVYAQKVKKTSFLLSPEEVEVYNFEASTKSTNGAHFEYEFEDDYSVKLTNKVYKISLFFNKTKTEAAQKAISRILDGKNTSSGFEKMVWKKKTLNGKLMYEIELKNNKLKIELIRKQMNVEAYDLLNALGREFIAEINS